MADKEYKKPPMGVLKAFLAVHIFLYRLSGGAIMGRFGKAPVLLLTARGRKSGKAITTPLVYVPTDRGQAVIASFAGAPNHPAWYLNLSAAGEADVQVGAKRWRAKAENLPIDGERYQKVWNDAVAATPGYAAYQAKTTRRIPIVELAPV